MQSEPTDSSHLGQLGQWVATLTCAAIPDDVRQAARVQVLNIVAAAHAGGRCEEAAPAIRATRTAAGDGAATVLASAERFAPADAAGVNAACSMAHDFDDIVWMGHIGHSAIFAALAVGEHENAGGDAFIDAVVVANEVAGRLGASSLLGPLNGQMWTFLHLIGAATATARLLGLDAERTAHALAIALTQPNFALQPAFMRPTSKLLSAATPTADGIRAAYLAAHGMTGSPDLLEDSRGFWSRFTYLPLPMMLGELGQLWVLRSLQIKNFPGCHYFQTACTALDRIRTETGDLRPADVAAVHVQTNKMGAEATRFAGEYACPGMVVEPVNVNFDLATTVAVMLEAGELTPRQMDSEWLRAHSEAIRQWRERIAVRHDPALTARVVAGVRTLGPGRAAIRALRPGSVLSLIRSYRREYRSSLFRFRELADWIGWAVRAITGRDDVPAAEPGGDTVSIALRFPNRVTITLTDGRTIKQRVDLPEGAFASPGVRGVVERKARQACDPVLGIEPTNRLIEAVLDDAEPPNVRALAGIANPHE